MSPSASALHAHRIITARMSKDGDCQAVRPVQLGPRPCIREAPPYNNAYDAQRGHSPPRHPSACASPPKHVRGNNWHLPRMRKRGILCHISVGGEARQYYVEEADVVVSTMDWSCENCDLVVAASTRLEISSVSFPSLQQEE